MEYPKAKKPMQSLDVKRECENCRWFTRIDSGYGWCILNPPQHSISFRFIIGFIIIPKMECGYPIVPWDLKACSEFLGKV